MVAVVHESLEQFIIFETLHIEFCETIILKICSLEDDIECQWFIIFYSDRLIKNLGISYFKMLNCSNISYDTGFCEDRKMLEEKWYEDNYQPDFHFHAWPCQESSCWTAWFAWALRARCAWSSLADSFRPDPLQHTFPFLQTSVFSFDFCQKIRK